MGCTNSVAASKSRKKKRVGECPSGTMGETPGKRPSLSFDNAVAHRHGSGRSKKRGSDDGGINGAGSSPVGRRSIEGDYAQWSAEDTTMTPSVSVARSYDSMGSEGDVSWQGPKDCDLPKVRPTSLQNPLYKQQHYSGHLWADMSKQQRQHPPLPTQPVELGGSKQLESNKSKHVSLDSTAPCDRMSKVSQVGTLGIEQHHPICEPASKQDSDPHDNATKVPDHPLARSVSVSTTNAATVICTEDAVPPGSRASHNSDEDGQIIPVARPVGGNTSGGGSGGTNDNSAGSPSVLLDRLSRGWESHADTVSSEDSNPLFWMEYLPESRRAAAAAACNATTWDLGKRHVFPQAEEDGQDPQLYWTVHKWRCEIIDPVFSKIDPPIIE